MTVGQEGSLGPDGYAGLPVGAFLDALAARTSAPAGGSAAALVLAQSAALCAKSARLSERQLAAGRAAEFTQEAEQIRGSAASLIDEDPRAYTNVLKARRRGDEQTQDPAAAAARLATALSEAADVPLRLVELAVPVSAIAATLADEGNQALRGDALAAGLLAQAAARAAACLVRINLTDEPGDVRLARVDALLARIDEHLR
ncbi:MAG TPA: cyclodeaminase/cyclohydrolase family protein [Streptosporangiaceae bacterium]|nr:cyclodeaminase/cyclohydrolase family protein [Streptosporangiaceae bacterium]